MWKSLLNFSGKTVGRALGAALLATALTACGGGEPAAGPVPAQGVVRLSDQFTGKFALIDMNGQHVTNDDFKGKVLIVYFGFATCPDVCPMALSRLSAALNELTEKELAKLVPVFITVDPERDTPEALKAYLGFNKRILGLTGSQADIDAARDAFKVYARRRPLPESALGYTMDHSSLFYIVDPSGQPTLALEDTLTPEEIATMLRRSIRG
ncbi:MAG TPA: SCO family protein [Parvularculaceae bacterium]|nr:SCO family protein [Amphiplicatus sp.]MCB9955145.1 SCO family protein [Caulobacterales bacterium]HOP19112.1 SCO family protein [Amphiplicatus sp.]HPE32020.1 SCO family protein [Parvularculaceae bacterium]HRX38172.1 SCO family protein [Parvularculaceae bacterium]